MSDVISVSVRRGALHFSGEIYERYFSGLDNVVLLRDGAHLVILPVRNPGAGGYVIKVRNSRGDRTVSAEDFFRDAGIADSIERTLTARWDERRAALVANTVFD